MGNISLVMFDWFVSVIDDIVLFDVWVFELLSF